MEFRDLKKQYQLHKKEIDESIQRVLDGTDFIMGNAVKELEKTLAEYVGVRNCVTCGNGTDALQLALMAWNIGPGDAVFVPTFTFFSSGEVVPLCGASPVFVDINPDTFNVDPDSLEDAIQRVLKKGELKPKVIIAVDLFGQPADFPKLKLIAQKYDLYILEDGAQGFGGRIGGNIACSFGDIATTSFFPAKPLGCYGDGGAVFTDNDDYAELLRSLRVHGKGADKYDNVRIGMNSRLDTIQAAILKEKIQFLDEEVKQCNHVAEQYSARLKETVKIPKVADGMYSSWAQYTICLKSSEEREAVQKELKKEGIPTSIYYKCPLHLQKAFSEQVSDTPDCMNAEKISKTCLSLPMHAYLTEEEIEKICRIICETVRTFNGELK